MESDTCNAAEWSRLVRLLAARFDVSCSSSSSTTSGILPVFRSRKHYSWEGKNDVVDKTSRIILVRRISCSHPAVVCVPSCISCDLIDGSDMQGLISASTSSLSTMCGQCQYSASISSAEAKTIPVLLWSRLRSQVGKERVDTLIIFL